MLRARPFRVVQPPSLSPRARRFDVVGPFPAELQNYIVLTAGIGTNAKDKMAAQALIKYLTSPTAISVIKAKGMEPG
jgi:molybdate transport system substrate-binding protein